MTKVLIYIKDGIVQRALSNGSIEVIVLDEEQDSASTLNNLSVENQTIAEFDRTVYESWKRTLSDNFKFDTDVEVSDEDPSVNFGFQGIADPKTFNDQPDGSITVDVEDQDGDWFTVDIKNVMLPSV